MKKTCKDCGASLIFRRRSKRAGETLWICSNGHKWQSRGVSVYRSNWKRQHSKVPVGVRVYPVDLDKLRTRGVSIQRLLDDAIRRELATGGRRTEGDLDGSPNYVIVGNRNAGIT